MKVTYLHMPEKIFLYLFPISMRTILTAVYWTGLGRAVYVIYSPRTYARERILWAKSWW